MAKVSMIERDNKRLEIEKKFNKKRAILKSQIKDKKLSIEERFDLQMQLNDLPRDSSQSRQRKRCKITGRPRGFYNRFDMSRIALRQYALLGQIPGLTKSSW